jgi:hypothetical protein
MQTLLPPAPATASTRFTGLPFFFYLLFLFLFPFSFSPYLFLFLFSFYFFPFSFLPSFNILIAILDGARKGIINSYQHFY